MKIYYNCIEKINIEKYKNFLIKFSNRIITKKVIILYI